MASDRSGLDRSFVLAGPKLSSLPFSSFAFALGPDGTKAFFMAITHRLSFRSSPPHHLDHERRRLHHLRLADRPSSRFARVCQWCAESCFVVPQGADPPRSNHRTLHHRVDGAADVLGSRRVPVLCVPLDAQLRHGDDKDKGDPIFRACSGHRALGVRQFLPGFAS